MFEISVELNFEKCYGLIVYGLRGLRTLIITGFGNIILKIVVKVIGITPFKIQNKLIWLNVKIKLFSLEY
jgi:hypothetical protein